MSARSVTATMTEDQLLDLLINEQALANAVSNPRQPEEISNYQDRPSDKTANLVRETLTKIGMQPYQANKMTNKMGGLASFTMPVAALYAGEEMGDALNKKEYGRATFNAAMVPLIAAGGVRSPLTGVTARDLQQLFGGLAKKQGALSQMSEPRLPLNEPPVSDTMKWLSQHKSPSKEKLDFYEQHYGKDLNYSDRASQIKGGTTDINQILRYGGEPAPMTKRRMDYILPWLDEGGTPPLAGPLYRGVKGDASRISKGDVLEGKGIGSFTYDPAVARSMGGNIIYRVAKPDKLSGRPISGMNEREFAVPPGDRFRVSNITQTNEGQTLVDLITTSKSTTNRTSPLYALAPAPLLGDPNERP